VVILHLLNPLDTYKASCILKVEGDTNMNEQVEIEEVENLSEDEIQSILSRETSEERAEYVAEYNAWFDDQFGGKE